MPNSSQRRPESQAILILTQALRAGEITPEFYAEQTALLGRLALDEIPAGVIDQQSHNNFQVRH